MPSPSDIAPNTLVPFHGFEKSFIHEPSDWETLFSIQSWSIIPESSISESLRRLATHRKGYTASPILPCMKSHAGHFIPPSRSFGPLFICRFLSPLHQSAKRLSASARRGSFTPVCARSFNVAATADAAKAVLKNPLLSIIPIRSKYARG